jgi:hypothetical protein
MNQELIQITQNLVIQKESGNDLKTWDKDELKVVKALESMHIGKCSRIEVTEHLKTCIALSGMQVPTNQIFNICVSFTIESYGQYKLKELGVAFKMFAEDKFSIDKHISFSPKLIGEVMNAYKKIAVEVRNKIEPEQPKQIEMKVDEEQVMREEAEYWKTSKKDWRFLNYQCFDYLWKRKLLKISPEKAEYIKSRVKAYHLAQAKKPEDMLVDEETMRQQCKKYTLKLYYDNEL